MRDVLHCQREIQVLLRTEVSGIQPHNAVLQTHRKTGAMHQPCIKDCVKIQCCYWFGLGLVLVLIKRASAEVFVECMEVLSKIPTLTCHPVARSTQQCSRKGEYSSDRAQGRKMQRHLLKASLTENTEFKSIRENQAI